MQSPHYFAGGNTAIGFFSCFEDILPRPDRKRVFYIKGGPGVGKSTFMRRIGEAAERAGLDVEYFHCSSDPDSLDGIAIPCRGVAMMDGTAPHVYDPVIPGACDTLLSLGDFLDEKALRPNAQEIARIQTDISSRFSRCYRYLAAAEQVFRAAQPGIQSHKKALKLAQEWAKTLPLRGGTGTIRRLFASAYTPKGFIDALKDMGRERRILLDCPFGLDATLLMNLVAESASSRGLHVVELLNPLSPAAIDHVIIPTHGIAFCTGRRAPNDVGEWIEAERAFDLSETSAKEESFDRNAYELLLQRASEQLCRAKELHDELERFYVGNMDFLKWQSLLDRILDELELPKA